MSPAEYDPTGPHLDAEQVGDLEEGLLDGAQEQRARGHLAACADCRGLREDLARLRARLRALGDPGPIPADVADRIETALAAAARPGPIRAASPRQVGDAVGAARRRRDARSWPGVLLGLAAAGVVVLTLGALLVPALRGGGSGSASTTSATSGGSSPASGGAGGSAAVPRAQAAPVPPVQVLASGRAYSGGTTFARQAAALVPSSYYRAAPTTPGPAPDDAGSPGAPSSSESTSAPAVPLRTAEDSRAAAVTGELAALRDPVRLAACVAAVGAGAPLTPLLVDLATYQGRPAAVIALRNATDPYAVYVFVVPPTCPKGQILRFERLAR